MDLLGLDRQPLSKAESKRKTKLEPKPVLDAPRHQDLEAQKDENVERRGRERAAARLGSQKEQSRERTATRDVFERRGRELKDQPDRNESRPARQRSSSAEKFRFVRARPGSAPAGLQRKQRSFGGKPPEYQLVKMRCGVAYYRDWNLKPPPERVPPEMLEPTWPTPVTIKDPRSRGRVEVIGICDVASAYCNASVLASGWDLGPRAFFLAPKDPKISDQIRHFANAEAAFLALQFWDVAHNFQDLTASRAWQLKKHLGNEDWAFAGYQDAWNAMAAVLAAKFAPESRCAEILVQTGDAFLLNQSATDKTWGNNGSKKDGKNWLGMMLMFLRDELRGKPFSSGPTWSEFLCDSCHIDPATGEPRTIAGSTAWRDLVRTATTVLMDQRS